MTELKLLGTGNAQAINCYNTCFTLTNEMGTLLVDAGGGNQILKILEEERIKLTDIRALFITHLHTDHILGIFWILRRIGETMLKGGYEGNLKVYLHEEAKEFVLNGCSVMLTKKLNKLMNDRIEFITHQDNDVREILGNKVTVFDIGSTKMKQFGFRMESESFVFVNAGDEPLSEKNYHFAEGADYLTHEAFCLYEDREIFKPYEKSHSTALDAAKLANVLKVKNLILYHTEDKTLATRKAKYTTEAKAHFSGNVFIPDDREVIRLQ